MNSITVVTTDRADYPDLLSENESMVRALEKQGFNVSVESWHELLEKLSQNEGFQEPLLIRTVWDYPSYLEKFEEFIELIRKQNAICVNPPEIIKWNLNKKYLFDLHDAGIPIVPCEYYPAGSTVPERKCKSVVKPVIGLGANGAQVLETGVSITVDVDSLVNPFRNSIHNGEISVVMIAGRPILFIKKVPDKADWRVQPQYGGEYRFADSVPDEAIEVCTNLYCYVRERFKSEHLLFMRVDLLQNDNDDGWEVLEFEAIDPSLYGAVSSAAVDTLANSLSSILK